MTPAAPLPVVFDCTIYAQALINPRGASGACLAAAAAGRLRLFISYYTLEEIRELPFKLKPRLRISPSRVEAFILELAKFAHPVDLIPAVFAYARDPDDAHYVNLAIAAAATLVVSRDKDLLDLMDGNTPAGQDFLLRFPGLKVVTPPTLLKELES